ncbi:AfsR/SARP family transcriptional regulator [Natranaerobius thermophilus]|uniref:Response regulator receiver and SARP domain protein n=1 Tax=Natranaerobius thermophilus (strain ATCC BAA-1301 / DSM 18059 / JW/NM-WN-LF) TaxID=457570 RepID=B2A195_NATTJ|nr:BTAD domain-containing putative transcriptional regulator [Natranaerobius thermophilus]ACB86033.1 response regulator receiver and SARP domain protein [Natranaerobius thermophilus JW/NM-WN-LF]
MKTNEEAFSDKHKRSNKVWELFKFLLINRNKRLHPNNIVEELWPDQEYIDPKDAVKSLVYRLRRLLKQHKSLKDHVFIDSSQGCYLFYLSEDSWVDIDEFESLSFKAKENNHKERETAMFYYHNAISLYRGTFLSEYPCKSWVFPIRQYYRRLYTNNLIDLVELLKETEEYRAIQNLCEKAFIIDLLIETEKIHVHYMEALVAEGQVADALSHFDFIKTVLEKELGIGPSDYMTEYYKSLKR